MTNYQPKISCPKCVREYDPDEWQVTNDDRGVMARLRCPEGHTWERRKMHFSGITLVNLVYAGQLDAPGRAMEGITQ